jgi:hypothetical protein
MGRTRSTSTCFAECDCDICVARRTGQLPEQEERDPRYSHCNRAVFVPGDNKCFIYSFTEPEDDEGAPELLMLGVPKAEVGQACVFFNAVITDFLRPCNAMGLGALQMLNATGATLKYIEYAGFRASPRLVTGAERANYLRENCTAVSQSDVELILMVRDPDPRPIGPTGTWRDGLILVGGAPADQEAHAEATGIGGQLAVSSHRRSARGRLKKELSQEKAKKAGKGKGAAPKKAMRKNAAPKKTPSKRIAKKAAPKKMSKKIMKASPKKVAKKTQLSSRNTRAARKARG